MATTSLSYIPQKYYLNQTAYFSPWYTKTVLGNPKVACHDDDDDDDDDEMQEKRNTHTQTHTTPWAYKPVFSYNLCWMYVGLLKNRIYDPTNHALQQHNTKLHFILIQHIAAMVPKWCSVVHRICNMTYCCNTFVVTDINTSQVTASPKASHFKHLIMSLNKQVSGLLYLPVVTVPQRLFQPWKFSKLLCRPNKVPHYEYPNCPLISRTVSFSLLLLQVCSKYKPLWSKKLHLTQNFPFIKQKKVCFLLQLGTSNMIIELHKNTLIFSVRHWFQQ